MTTAYPVLHERADAGWTDWVAPYKHYRLVCCDCGLAHDMEFRVILGEAQFRARRNNRSTGQIRRHKK